MTTFVPDAGRLVQASVDYLEQDLLPTLEGYHRFQLRVCVNALRIVARELEHGRALEDHEQQRLQQLLGQDGSVQDLNEELTHRLACGRMALDTNGLAEHLRSTLRDALRINNPAWIQEEQ